MRCRRTRRRARPRSKANGCRCPSARCRRARSRTRGRRRSASSPECVRWWLLRLSFSANPLFASAPVAQARAKARQRLPVQLAYARLGHAEHGADFLEVQLFVVVERHQQLFPLRQTFDRFGKRGAPAFFFVTTRRRAGFVVADFPTRAVL